MKPSYTVYILKTSKNTFYTGQTSNLERRLAEHKAHGSKSAKYMRYFSSFELVYTETLPTRSDALKREAALKRLSHAQKEVLISAAKLVK